MTSNFTLTILSINYPNYKIESQTSNKYIDVE